MTEERKIQTIKVAHGILYAVKDSRTASVLAAEGKPVVGILTEENQRDPFTGVSYLCGEEFLTDAKYLDRIYCRIMGIPWEILQTTHCIVRETVESDAKDFYRIYDDNDARAYMEPLYEDPVKEERYLSQYRKNIYGYYEYGIWTVTDRENGNVIGRAGLDPVEIPGITKQDETVPQLGYIIEKAYRGRGIAKEVCSGILHYGFTEYGFPAVYAMTHRDNTASVQLLKKLQFREKGPSKESPFYVLYEKVNQ